MSDKISTWHIHIKGQVQGVGFRPFVYKLASKLHLKGWVNNTADGVHVEFNADEQLSDLLYARLIQNAPPLSLITSHQKEKKSFAFYEDFKIIPSGIHGKSGLLLSPDFGICEECSKEIRDITNRRYAYAFTTCTQCGPRYSIIKGLPYDRDNTTMDRFQMCPICQEEYHDPLNRRHFSQTNSCPGCPVTMTLFDNNRKIIEEDQLEILNKITDLWKEGKIVAIKGTGGYLLTCDAANKNTVLTLRKRKIRPSKPLAMLFPDMDLVQATVYVGEHEKKEIQGKAAPIVLLQVKEEYHSNLALAEIAPGLSRIGVMLPNTPLQQMLLDRFSKPIVATSGNTSNAPIVIHDDVALDELNSIADYILTNNREITAPQDDSVLAYSRHGQQRIVLRRARGFAPLYSNQNLSFPQKTILALGALVKSSFCLLHQQNVHVSQYLGNTDSYDTQIRFEETLHYFLGLFQTRPEVILVDKHPDYFTSQLGESLASIWKCSLVKVQHHEAHFAAVLGEYNLFNDEGPVLGVIWDGTGWGTDAHIWGGEFFVYQERAFSRVNHFDYFNHFLGDKMVQEPRLSGFSLCHELEDARSILEPKFTETELRNYLQLIRQNNLKTSSVGRIFDAVATLIGLIDKSSYEGEAAMLLEEAAQGYFKNELTIPAEWLAQDALEQPLSGPSIMMGVIKKIKAGTSKHEIAAWFHVQLVLAVRKANEQLQCRRICFSGGVFQNGLLVDLIIKILGNDYKLFFNSDLSPNDENIAFGQVIWYMKTNNYNK